MADNCLGQTNLCRMRVARLDSNGVPRPGANNMYVTDLMATISVDPVYVDGDEIEEKNGCGAVMVSRRSPDTLKRLSFELMFLTPAPQLTEILVGGAVLTTGAKVGYAFPRLGVINDGGGKSIEWWTEQVDSGDLDETYPAGRWVAPKVRNLRIGKKDFGNGKGVNTIITGQMYENENWYNGPVNDWTVASNAAAFWLPDAVMPNAVCGYQTVAAS